jgi:hypothetical protein
MMQIFNKYRLWVVNTACESQLYLWKNWKHLFPLIDTLVTLSPAKAFIRSGQSMERENRMLGFGRMPWSKENNEKWTKKYREDKFKHFDVMFFDTEVWAPDWNQVDNIGIPPDIFIRLYNEPRSEIAREGLIVAIKKSIADKNAAAIEPVIADISRRVQDSTVANITRSWFPGVGFDNRIQDMNPFELEMVLRGNVKPSLAHRIQSILKSKKTDA